LRTAEPGEETATAVAIKLQQYLDKQSVPYDVLVHKRTACSTQTALASQVPRDCLAKGVVIKHRKGYLLAVVPASRDVRLEELGSWLHEPVCLATEDEVSALFPDCEHGAVPPLAAAYGVTAIVDASLDGHEDIYFEGGDHRALVHVAGSQFKRLVESMPHAQFSAPASSDALGMNGSPKVG
jgi:Ala-tRNA(Pro) deacylase